MVDVYEFTNYKDFLNRRLDELDGPGRGSRARLSRAVACQTAYTAQVLRGSAHFSLEQAESINEFLGHTEEQGRFFLLLVQLARAGSKKLRDRFERQLREIKLQRSILHKRIGGAEPLPEQHQLRYYSSWIHGAVHALAPIPEFRGTEKIAACLRITTQQAGESLDFLIRAGLLERSAEGRISVGRGQIHLSADSPLIHNHHRNWRLQAIQAIERDPQAGLHYSSVLSVSRKDEALIRERILQMLLLLKPIIRDSKEEEVCSFSLDFFRLS